MPSCFNLNLCATPYRKIWICLRTQIELHDRHQKNCRFTLIGFGILNYSRWETSKYCHITTHQIFCLKQAQNKCGNNSLLFVCCFVLKTGTTWTFSNSEVNFPFFKHDQKIIPRDLQIDSSQIFDISILFILRPRALFGLRFLIIFKISYLENQLMKVTGTCFH